jgi:tripartite-type tricarboxylate transporter receptor subunit TctC
MNDSTPHMQRRQLLGAAAALCAAPFASLAPLAAQAQDAAQAWPARPVRVIVPYAPGNISDSSVRVVCRHLSTLLGQQFVVENKAGANTQIGTDFVGRSEADGYTLLYTGPILTVMGPLFDKLTFDPMKDLTPVSQAIANPTVFLVKPDFPAKDMREFIALTKKDPGKYFVASGGIGTMPHMAHELLVSMAGLQSQHVPYRGGSSWMNDFFGGQVTGIFDNPSSAMPLIKDGRAKPLAVTSLTRNPALPDVPTIAELGVPGFEVMNWFGFFAPARTPPAILDKMSASVGKVMQMPEVADGFTKIGVTPVGNSREKFGEIVASDHRKWARTVKERNIKPE